MSGYRGEIISGKDRQRAVDGEPYGSVQSVTFIDPVLEDHWSLTPIQPRAVTTRDAVMGRRFTVLDNFTSEELRSEYVAGLSYEARDEDTVLLGLIDKWIEEGKVREGGPEAQVTGSDEAEATEDDEPPKKKRYVQP